MNPELKPEYLQTRFLCAVTPSPPFFIVTAYNPEGMVADEAANRRADERLRAEIDRLGYGAVPVTGGSPDLSHAEPGYGIRCSRAEAVALARQFRQQAVFEVREDQVWLISAMEPTVGDEPVGRWSDLRRPGGGATRQGPP